VIDERTAPLLAAAIGSSWADSKAFVSPADHPPYRAGLELSGTRAASLALVGCSLVLGLWVGGAQTEDSRQRIAHAPSCHGSFTESPRRGHPTSGRHAATGAGRGGTVMRTSNSMKAVMAGATISAAITAGSGAQDAVQWRVQDGGNGHWYQFKTYAVPTQWDAARAASSAVGGYLACVNSAEEQAFLIFIAPNYVDESGGQAWLGGYQDTTAPDFAEPHQGWRWVSGEPLTYQGWYNSGTGWGADYMTLAKDVNGNFGWNDLWTDYFGGRRFAFVEWSADCNSDGIVDFGQIRAGQLPDGNANGVPDCCESDRDCCIGDIYRDGVINGADLGIVLADWGPAVPTKPSDLDGNGRVDGADLGMLLANWGACGG
jgi:hypothetical protein